MGCVCGRTTFVSESIDENINHLEKLKDDLAGELAAEANNNEKERNIALLNRMKVTLDHMIAFLDLLKKLKPKVESNNELQVKVCTQHVNNVWTAFYTTVNNNYEETQNEEFGDAITKCNKDTENLINKAPVSTTTTK